MMDDSSDRQGKQPSKNRTNEDQRRRLELELVRIRSEASAARLEARAAELELLIRELAVEDSTTFTDAPESENAASGTPINPPHIPIAVSAPRFASWDEVREVLGPPTQFENSFVSNVAESAPTNLSVSSEPASETVHRIDASHGSVPGHHFVDSTGDQAEMANPVGSTEASESSFGESDPPAQTLVELPPDESSHAGTLDAATVNLDAESDIDETEKRRGRPAALVTSAIVHVALLLVLAAIGLQTQRPKDQIALAASTTEANEVSMETFSIESSEPEPEVSEPTPSETEYDLSPVGELAASEFAPEAPPAPPSPLASAMTSSEASASAAMSVESDSDAKIQFCGVEGGGNHFVYLVDSSGSMGDGFESARRELLASIDALKPDQRFYVVFFDAESDYMRLHNAKEDESTSVFATPENKAALRRWAMRISMDRGRAPYDPLRFALKLKPDVIFLLSDGEFPQGIEDLLKEENKVENLFGDSHPISIVHTISYHSKEGESRMRRIAEQNDGQYRYIPKP